MKCPQMRTRGSFGPPPQPNLTLVYSDLQRMSVFPNGDRNNSFTQGFVGTIDLTGCQGCCIHDGAGPSSSSTGGAEPFSKGPTLGLSCRYPLGMRMVLIASLRCSLLFCFCPKLKSGVVVTGVVPHQSWSHVGDRCWRRQ
jgi:hypothetical protein